MLNSGYGKADLHMHTTHSDGLATVHEMLMSAAERGLNVVAITDHDRLSGSLWAYQHRHYYPFDIIPGVEISTRGGHMLGLWVTQPIPRGLSVKETIQAIHRQGGVAVLAHPFHIHMHYVARNALNYWREPEKLIEWGLDAVEVHNAGMFTPFTNLIARAMARRAGLAGLGSSDAHTSGAVGSGLTYFPGTSADELRQAILDKTTVAVGRAWSAADYRLFIYRHLILKRGKIFTEEWIEEIAEEFADELPEESTGMI